MNNLEKDGKLSFLALLLAPIAVLPALLVMIPLGILALVSIPYYFVFPEHHMHQWDLGGTERQRALLAKWRAAYKRLGLFGRVRRGFLVRARRGRARRGQRNLSAS